MEEKKCILIVEDERAIVEILKFNLKREGYDTLEALDGEAGLELARTEDPDLILLDVMLPKMNGFDICKNLREAGSSVPIIMLTAREEETDKVFGLEAGADDYIAKPIRVKVLVSRIKALLKRFDTVPNEAPAADRPIVIDRERYLVLKEGKEIVLPRKEFELLALLYSKPQKVFSREEIFSNVWGNDVIVGDRTIDVHVRKLREKLGDHHIVTIKGVGYKYED